MALAAHPEQYRHLLGVVADAEIAPLQVVKVVEFERPLCLACGEITRRRTHRGSPSAQREGAHRTDR